MNKIQSFYFFPPKLCHLQGDRTRHKYYIAVCAHCYKRDVGNVRNQRKEKFIEIGTILPPKCLLQLNTSLLDGQRRTLHNNLGQSFHCRYTDLLALTQPTKNALSLHSLIPLHEACSPLASPGLMSSFIEISVQLPYLRDPPGLFMQQSARSLPVLDFLHKLYRLLSDQILICLLSSLPPQDVNSVTKGLCLFYLLL